MTSAQQIKKTAERRRRRGRLLLAAGACLTAVLMASWLLGGSDPDRTTPTPTESVPDASGGSSAAAVTLPEAKQLLDERFPVGFPHTPEGAVGAMAAMLSSTWTMSAENNRLAADVYAQPAIRAVARQAATPAATDLRQRVGLPAAGSIPTGAYVSLTPTGVRLRVVTTDQVQVAMMVTVSSAASAQAAPSTRTATVGAGWVWNPRVRGGDWVFTGDNVDDLVPQIADPATPQFSRLGWRAVTP